MRKIIIIVSVLLSLAINIAPNAIATPIFTSDWFSGNIKDWNKYQTFFEGKNNLRCLEVGSYEGRSTIYIAENYCKYKDSVLYALDTWRGSREHDAEHEKDLFERFSHNLKSFIDNKRVIPFREESRKSLVKFLNSVLVGEIQKFDFIYIDGSHIAKDVMLDVVLAWELLKVGGIIIMDDYLWGIGNKPELTPKPALDGFLESYKGSYEILLQGYQVHLRKVKD